MAGGQAIAYFKDGLIESLGTTCPGWFCNAKAYWQDDPSNGFLDQAEVGVISQDGSQIVGLQQNYAMLSSIINVATTSVNSNYAPTDKINTNRFPDSADATNNMLSLADGEKLDMDGDASDMERYFWFYLSAMNGEGTDNGNWGVSMSILSPGKKIARSDTTFDSAEEIHAPSAPSSGNPRWLCCGYAKVTPNDTNPGWGDAPTQMTMISQVFQYPGAVNSHKLVLNDTAASDGYGSTDTKINQMATLSTKSKDVSSANTAANGMKITVLQEGMYVITMYGIDNSAGLALGCSVNSNQLTTNIDAIDENDIGIFNDFNVVSQGRCTANAVRYCNKGDIIRPHGNAEDQKVKMIVRRVGSYE